MLEFALGDFADAGAVEPLAGETGEIVAEGALSGPSVAIASQCKLAQLINFRACSIIHLIVYLLGGYFVAYILALWVLLHLMS